MTTDNMLRNGKIERPQLKEKCEFHSSIDASYVCDSCGKSICRYCERNGGVPYQCPECISGHTMGKRRRLYKLAALLVGIMVVSAIVVSLIPEEEPPVRTYSRIVLANDDIYIAIEDGSYNISGDGKVDLTIRMYVSNTGNTESGPLRVEAMVLDNSIIKGYANVTVDGIGADSTRVLNINDLRTDLGSYELEIIVWEGDKVSFKVSKRLVITEDDLDVQDSGPTTRGKGSPNGTVDDMEEAYSIGSPASASCFLPIAALIIIIVGAIILYSRLSGPQVLDNNLRHRVYGHIKSNPGVHFRGIMRDLGMRTGTLKHHLETLEREGFVRSAQDGMYKRFYPSKTKVEKNSPRANSTQHYIVSLVNEYPGITQKDIAAILHLTPQTINYHVSQMLDANRIFVEKDGKWTCCYPAGMPVTKPGEGDTAG